MGRIKLDIFFTALCMRKKTKVVIASLQKAYRLELFASDSYEIIGAYRTSSYSFLTLYLLPDNL